MASSRIDMASQKDETQVEPIVVSVSGMTCAGCASRVERHLKSLPGVSDAMVNFALERATVAPEAGGPDTDGVIAAVTDAGFTATPFIQGADPAEALRHKAERRSIVILAIAAFLTLPMIIKMAVMMTTGGMIFGPWWELALATPVQFVAGWRFYRGAWVALKHRSGTMDTLVALGTSAAYFYSLAVLILGIGDGHLYFEAAAVIVTLILAGRVLEARAKRKTGEAIRALMKLRPETAQVMRDGAYKSLPLALIRVDDTVLVRPGDRVPVDGEVIDGRSDVDEAMLTGESLPVPRAVGDAVFTGTINGMGALTVKVTAVAEDSRLGRIVTMVENAQSGKAPVQALVDRISAVFVPTVLVVALITFAGWVLTGGGLEQAVISAVAVLVIACPCALGLATPTAIVAGMGAAARSGILFRNVEALEAAFRSKAVVFDKTGTLTEGKPRIVELVSVQGELHEALRLSAAIQSGSDHPLARAFTAHASDQGVALPAATSIEVMPGFGLSGQAEGHAVLVGNAALMERQGVDLSGDPVGEEGYTKSYVAVDGELMALALLEDQVRTDAGAVIDGLKAEGMRTVLLSGDAPVVVSKLAERLGMDQAFGGILPEGKADQVASLQTTGEAVAMVGDGINDAPALATADVGIAVGSGTDVALETAGVALMRPDLKLVPAVMRISRRTVWKIRQNLFWAFIFNIVGIPLAAFGLLNPMIAGGAMAFSSVLVLTNSLLLRGWRAETSGRAS